MLSRCSGFQLGQLDFGGILLRLLAEAVDLKVRTRLHGRRWWRKIEKLLAQADLDDGGSVEIVDPKTRVSKSLHGVNVVKMIENVYN